MASRPTGGSRRGNRRRQQAHEHGELHHVAGNLRVLREGVRAGGLRREVGRVLRVAVAAQIQAAGGQAGALLILTRQGSLVLENLVGNAHLDVVGLTREQLQGFVLGLPAEAGNGAVIAVVVERAADAEAIVGLGGLVLEERRIIDVFQQSGAEHGGRNTENDVIGLLGGSETRLLQTTG